MGTMGTPSINPGNLYAPPRSQSAKALPTPSLRWRFWLTCFGAAIVLPALFYSLSPSAWLGTSLAVLAWALAAYWILIPYLRLRDRAEALDLTYIVCIVIGVPPCTGLAFILLFVAMAVMAFFFASVL
ncbi:hypothetical protein GCM10027159_06960 [Lysobacter terrae]